MKQMLMRIANTLRQPTTELTADIRARVRQEISDQEEAVCQLEAKICERLGVPHRRHQHSKRGAQ